MINAIPGMGGMALPEGVTPEMLANPQFLAMLRAQMGGGGAQQPRMGGGGGGMPQGPMQQQSGGGIFGAGGMGQLAQFLRPYMQQQQPGARQDNNAGNLGNGLLGALPSFNDGGAKAGTSGAPGGYQEVPVQQGLLAGYGGLY